MKLADLAKEIQTLKSLRHERLIRLHAVCSAGEPVYVVTELMSKGSLQAFLGSECGPSPRPACGLALLARGTDACLLRATGQQWARGPWSGPGLALWRDSQRGVPGWVEGGRLRPRVWHQPLNGVCMDPAQPPVSPAPTGPSVLPVSHGAACLGRSPGPQCPLQPWWAAPSSPRLTDGEPEAQRDVTGKTPAP